VATTTDVATRTPVGERSDGVFRPAPTTDAPPETPDPRGCLTCLATRTPTQEEWNAALADAATKKAAPDAATSRVTPGLADGRTSDERMRDAFAARYGEEMNRLAAMAGDVDRDLQGYLSACFERFASIPVAGAAPRSNSADEILKAARSSRSAARFALMRGNPEFQWNSSWAPSPDPTSSQPSCDRLWQDVRTRTDRLEVDMEYLARDAREHDIYPGVIREMLSARGLLPPVEGGPPPTQPVSDIR
jgi:hypothetical protein